MIPFGTRTVTLVHRFAEGGKTYYLATKVSGCSWYARHARKTGGTTVTQSDGTVCRIPAGAGCKPTVGDILVLGSPKKMPNTASEYAEMLSPDYGGEAFLVTEMHDNTGDDILPHYYCRG